MYGNSDEFTVKTKDCPALVGWRWRGGGKFSTKFPLSENHGFVKSNLHLKFVGTPTKSGT
ncbi:hypothetical protein DLM77_04770 [Leptospira yasudae]|uniref:Uncharacterized protein n=1 Tax=Leptospira yasudae TaxID=2202201 RepID=A0ABX9M703_9LEPT|nr:hypothetical protein DLM77_04770 [Leptospira yasudae]